jgi:hypothetical protein
MTKPAALNSAALRRLCCFSVLTLSLARAQAQYDPDWTWNVRAGVMAGFNIKSSFKTGSTLSISGGNPGTTNAGVNHFFNDGYVRVDDFKNAGGYTTYWGYQDASQNDTANNRILYHSGSTFNTTSGSSISGNSENANVGFEVAAGGYLWRWEHMRLGFDLGFGYLPINMSAKEATSAKPLSGSLDFNTYAFQVPNGVVLPGAPYNGGPSGFGQPSIHDVMSQVGSSNTSATLAGTQTLEVTLYSFRLGPSLYWDLSRYFGLSVSAGPAIGFVTGNLNFNETITIGNNPPTPHKGGFSSTEFVYGGYVNATLTYHAVANGDFYLSAQYMPLSNANFSGGGRSARLDMHGAVYVSAGINWPF